MSYDPAIGRFLERDPIGYDDGMNQYQYVRSNPVKYVDPSGLSSEAVGAWGPASGWNQQAGPDVDKANQGFEGLLALRVAVWAAAQKRRLGAAIAALGTGATCCNDPAAYRQQAQEYADAIVDAVAAKRLKDGEQVGAGWSSWSPLPSVFACGHWQSLTGTALNPGFQQMGYGEAKLLQR